MADPLLPEQEVFARRFAQRTGLDLNVVRAWLLSEQSGSAARYYQGRGFYDWLNIGITDSGPMGAGYSAWRDPTTAADASAAWLQGRQAIPGFGSASAGVRGIAAAAGGSPAQQIQAIQHSGWASSGYPNLASVYTEVSGQTAGEATAGAPVRPPRPLTAAGGGGGGGVFGDITGILSGGLSTAFGGSWLGFLGGNPISTVVDFLKMALWLVQPANWLRMVEFATGMLLMLLGLVGLGVMLVQRSGMVGQAAGVASALPGPVGAAGKAVTAVRSPARAARRSVRAREQRERSQRRFEERQAATKKQMRLAEEGRQAHVADLEQERRRRAAEREFAPGELDEVPF